jgi:hypothetical protein
MGKIPVGRTLSETLSFVFGRYPALLGAVWLPLLIIGVTYYFAFVPFFKGIAEIARQAALHPHAAPLPPDMNAIMRFMPLATLVGLVVSPWMQIGLTKAALGLPRRFPATYLEYGNDEFRMIAANLLVFALTYGAIIAAVIVGAIVAAIGAALVAGGAIQGIGAKAVLVGLGIVAVIGALCAFVYAALRITFFLAPVTVMEKKIAVARSWELGKGNVWRIFGILIVVILILAVFELVFTLIFVMPVVFTAVATHAGAGSHDPAVVFTAMGHYWPVLLLLGLLVLPILFGLQMTPPAFAYRALMETPKPDAPLEQT